jgi:hypothetical protein
MAVDARADVKTADGEVGFDGQIEGGEGNGAQRGEDLTEWTRGVPAGPELVEETDDGIERAAFILSPKFEGWAPGSVRAG